VLQVWWIGRNNGKGWDAQLDGAYAKNNSQLTNAVSPYPCW